MSRITKLNVGMAILHGHPKDVPVVFVVEGNDSFASFQFRVGKLDLSRYGIGYD